MCFSIKKKKGGKNPHNHRTVGVMLEEGNEERNINPTKKQGNFALIFFKEINQHTTADPCRGGHEIAITPYNPKAINNKYSNK